MLSQTLWSANLDQQYLEDLIEKSRKNALSKERQWLALLYYAPNFFSFKWTSLVDGPDFFQTKAGHFDPQIELETNLKSFLTPPHTSANPELHSQCRYPARWYWLQKHLAIDKHRVPKLSCDHLWKAFKDLNIAKVSVVFSSYYPNNPASLFGHTFLRLHRHSLNGLTNSALLDHAINFSAQVTPEQLSNPLAYSFNGLFGRFYGRFSLTPYYFKVQEYNNSERRDLWEFELVLNQEQITLVLLSLWELHEQDIPYYYFNKNCSYVLLGLLQVALPEHEFMSGWGPYATPADTLKTVLAVPNILANVNYRPSNRSQFSERYEQLASEHKKRLLILIASEEIAQFEAALEDIDAKAQAYIIDAAISYIEFQERLAGSKLPEQNQKLFTYLLKRRAGLYVAGRPLTNIPTQQQPNKGHKSGRVQLSLGSNFQRHGTLKLGVRPALHDLASDDLGFAPGLEIQFFNTELMTIPKREQLYLSHFGLIEILSLDPWTALSHAPSWRLGFNYERLPVRINNYTWEDITQIYGGSGIALSTADRLLQVYSIPTLSIGMINSEQLQSFCRIIFHSGMILSLPRQTKIKATVDYTKWLNKNYPWELSSMLTASWLINNLEARLNGDWTYALGTQYSLGLGIYW